MDDKKLSRELEALVQDFEPSPEFLRLGRKGTKSIYRALRVHSSGLSVARLIVAGSIGKKPFFDDTTDFDVVVFLNDAEPKFSRELLEKMAKSIQKLPFRGSYVTSP
jgi:tRNA nucleotidyltransferase (CCA-adding enzyme)